jgi:pimeloyl-ACP methyl ester carboxylesterase
MALTKIQYNNFSFSISYEVLNFNSQKTILFLHGWGSNKEIMKQSFSKNFSDFKHIYVDMVGFGKSETPHHGLNTVDYKNIIELFLIKIESENPLVIVGHSFGGKVATLLNPKNLVLLSSSGVLLPKKFSTKLKITLFKIFKSLGLSFLRKFFVSNDVKNMPQSMYETFKNVVDEDFREKYQNFTNNALIFWGKQDITTPPLMGEITNKLIKKSKLFFIDGDHYFFMQNSNFNYIEKEILENLHN